MMTDKTKLAGSLQSAHRDLQNFATTNLPKRGSATKRLLSIVLLSLIAMAATAWAQLPIPASSQFDVTGFIQSATLGGPGTGAGAGAHQGGNITVNGHLITVPSETIVILPANALTWQELFALAPAPYGPTQTGMALSDLPAPLTTYEAQVVGNRVLGGPGGPDVYIAGLIFISQHSLNSGNGFINCINHATGEMRVGGVIGNCATGARVQINDPVGRFGRVMSPDARFSVDDANPTIAAATGFPMCLPRVLADPSIPGNPDDGLCPLAQRPIAVAPAVGFATVIQMNDPVALAGVPPDATIQAPMQVGDWVTFAGTLVADPGVTAGPTAGPWPGIANTYISAHTISSNVAIYTWPNSNPSYVATEVALIGTGGLTVVGAGEAVIRTRFEGMTTDVNPNPALQRKIHLYGIDYAPITGTPSDRDFGTIGVDPGPPLGAVKGRWRFRPPCDPFGSVPAKPDKTCVMNAAGSFLPPPREVRAVIEGAWVPGQVTTFANGIIAGQYHAPILEYIFPENVPGAPIPENNFNTIPFLAQGGYSSSTGTIAGQLDPWPSNITPIPACAPPAANAGGPYAVASSGTVGLIGTSAGTGPFTWAWTASAGTLSDPTLQSPNFTAPAVAVATSVNLTLTVTNSCGASTATSTVAVSAALAPTVNAIAPQAVDSGSSGSFAVSGTDSNNPASLPLTWTVSQSGAPALTGLSISPTGSSAAAVNYTAPSGVLTVTNITVTVTATNAAGVASAPVSTTVTINPVVAGCVAPVANAGGPYSVNSGGSVSLAGSASGTTPITFSWAPPASGSIAPLNSAAATFTAPVVLAQTLVNVSLTASNSCGTSTASSTVTVNAALAPTANAVAPKTVFSGAINQTVLLSGSDPNVPALTPLTFTVTQAPAGTLLGLTVTPTSATTATVSFNAPVLPIGQVAPTVVTLTITARNTAPLTSAPVTTTVTINPLPDLITVTAAEYRTGKQRLILTATSSVNSANVVLKLQPYLTTTGTIYNPDPAAGGVGNTFTLAAGVYTLDVVGAPRPACGNAAGYQTPCPTAPLDVRSNLNGDSGLFALTKIRQ